MEIRARRCVILVLLICSTLLLHAQPGSTIHLKNEKPAEYAKKLLRSEKTDYGPLGKFQQFMQNTFTRFNYLYNANKHLEDIIEKATTNYKEDYATLLTYYPYDEKAMSANTYLDSVINHTTAGILLHDLRNQYVDELYFLLGKAYYYQQKYDTAQQVFQYLNYAFAPKDDGYDLPVGSNISKIQGNFTILNPEHKGISKNSYARKERRNDGLIWQVKNYIQSGDFIQARVLLGYIEKDSLLPARLKPLVAATHGFLFYRLKKYDSAASYLVRTDYSLYNRKVRPRMYYLTGQLFALGGDSTSAALYYERAKSAAIDPLLSIYAALAEASMKNTDQGALSDNADSDDQHYALLKKLSKRDKYKRYKDVIYFAEAIIKLNQNDTAAGRALLLTSVAAGKNITPPNNWQKSRTYFTLANLNYDANKFYNASRFYDSVNSPDLTQLKQQKLLTSRTPPLNQVATHLDSIYYQDSLQQLAALPEKQRMDILKDKAREIRKAVQKRQEDRNDNFINPAIRRPAPPTTLFPTGSNASIWYFNNPALRNSGFQLFKQKFGNRPNVDNWQRVSAINGSSRTAIKSATSVTALNAFNPDGSLKLDSSNIQPEDLLVNLPLTEKQIANSNNQIASRLFNVGKILQNSMENFTGALYVYDSLMRRFPKWDSTDAVLFNQYICWTLLGKKDQASLVRTRLKLAFKNSSWTHKILSQDSVKIDVKETSLQNKATYAYNEVYQLFVEGDFKKADSLKQLADKQYGTYYWTPQLLYIESVYQISEHQDSIAIVKLNYLIKRFRSSPIREQAKHLLSILQRRSEIEAYLRQLRISPNGYIHNSRLSRLESAAAALADQRERRIGLLRNQKILDLSDTSQTIGQLSGTVLDLLAGVTIKGPDTSSSASAVVNTERPDIQTDSIKSGIPVNIINKSSKQKDASEQFAVITPPEKQKDKIPVSIPEKAQDSTLLNKLGQQPTPNKPDIPTIDALQPTPAEKGSIVIGGFTFNPAATQYLTVVLHKVAPVFASEAANAFNRYNLLAFEHQKWPVSHKVLGDYDLVQIGPFKDYKAAKDYLKQIQGVTPTTILPWLTGNKYDFIIVSPQNTNKLNSAEDLIDYQAAWKQFESK